MTPELWAAIASFVDRYGLPLVILGGFLYLMLKGKLVTGSQLATTTALFERERTDRLAAEAVMEKVAPALTELAKSVELLAGQVAKSQRRVQ